MRSRFPHGGEVLGAAPANPILAPVLSKDLSLSISRQRDLLDLQAIRRIPGLVGYWKNDPQYLYEDSAGTTPASTGGTGPVGCWRRVGDAPVYSPITIANPGFDTDTDWSKGTGWTIAGGVATKSAGTASSLSQAISVIPGTMYLVTFTITVTSGLLIPKFTGGTEVVASGVGVTGAYEAVLVATTGNNTLTFYGNSTFAGTLDTIALFAVSNTPALQTTTANKPILRKTPTTGVYWLDANTSTSALNVALSDTVLGRRNLLQYSEQLEAGWTKTRVSIGVDSTTTWDGVQIADKVIEDTSSSANHYLTINSLVVGATTTINLEVKSAERSVIEIKAGSSTTTALWFDATNNTFSTIGGAITAYSSSALGSGWYRIKFTCVPPSSTALTISLINGSGNYTGDGTSGIYITRIQAELGSVATDYQKITNVPAYCTLARATAEGVTFTDNAEISPTYNIAPAFSFNADVAIFNRALTDVEKALITRYMARAVPMLGNNVVTNGTFDTDTTGWSAENSATLSVDTGRLRVVYNGVIGPYAKQGVPTTNGSRYLLACSLIRGNSSSGIAARVYADSGGSTNLYSSGYKIVGTTILSVLTASSSTSYIWALVSASSNGTYDFADNISLKEIL